MQLPSLTSKGNKFGHKKPKISSPRGTCERFGIVPGDLQKMEGEAQRSNAVFASREVLMSRYNRMFPDDASVVNFLFSADPGHRIVREYKNLLKRHGWQQP